MLEWEEMYNLVKIYMLNNQTTSVEISFRTKDGITYDEDGYDIGKWLNEQIIEYKKKNLIYKKAKKIKQLNLFKTSRSINNDKKWEEMYNLVKIYYEHYKTTEIPVNFKTNDGINYSEDGKNLYSWLANQRTKRKSNSLSIEKVDKLNKIHISWKANCKRWCKMFNIAKSYYYKYGNCCIPIDDGEQYKKQLEDWLVEQQEAFDKGTLTEAKINNLKCIGIDLNEDDLIWNTNYNLLEKYKEFYQDLYLPVDFKTKDGINYSEDGINLYRWVSNQRTFYKIKKLKLYKVAKLKKLDFIWNYDTKKWEDAYELAKKYYEHYGDLKIDINFKTKDGINYHEDGYGLGIWVNHQKKSYSTDSPRKLSDEEIDKLNQINIIWNAKIEMWYNNYKLAKKYYKHYGNLIVPKNFKTKDGINYDEGGINLYAWVKRQRALYSGISSYELSDDKIEKLNKIGMIWNVYDNNWNINYNLVSEYYRYNGNLNIPIDFKTKDGINYSEDGINLYNWIVKQIQLYKNNELSKDKLKRIKNITLIYNSSKSSFRKKKITKKNLLEIKGQLLEFVKVKLEEYNDKEFNSKEDINQINDDFAKVFNSNK